MEATENDRDVIIEQVETLEKTIRELKEKFHIDWDLFDAEGVSIPPASFFDGRMRLFNRRISL